MLTNHLWPRKLALLALGLLIPLAGCANLTAIREFASISSDAAGYRRVVDDYVTGPDRTARYVSPCPDCQRQHDEKKRQEPLLLLEQNVVQAYMEALGELAADDLVDYSKEYDALGAAAESAKLIAADKAEAAATLAKLLTKAATDHWRQRQLKEIIARANPPLQIVLDGLRTVMNAFEVDLSDEKEHARNYYGSLVLGSWRQAVCEMLGTGGRGPEGMAGAALRRDRGATSSRRPLPRHHREDRRGAPEVVRRARRPRQQGHASTDQGVRR